MSTTSLKRCALALTALTAIGGAAHAADTMPAKARFAVLPATHPEAIATTTGLTTWKFSYTYNNGKYTDTFVGNAPTGAATTTPSFIIPMVIVVSGQTFDPRTKQTNGHSALKNTVKSPIFSNEVRFREAGTTLGKTQYIDAFERENFWTQVSANPGYHVLLGKPTIEPTLTLNVPKGTGSVGTEFGVKVALVDINYIDAQIHTYLSAHPEITAASVPVFMAYNTYETSGGCCIGGYHSANGGQTYMMYDYVGTPKVFSQDVSALSHEMGEWLNDPYINNNSPCGIYEVGDPLERESNYGGYPYTVDGFTYNLQDLAAPPYFGAPPSTSLDGRATFQGTKLSVCQNGA